MIQNCNFGLPRMHWSINSLQSIQTAKKKKNPSSFTRIHFSVLWTSSIIVTSLSSSPGYWKNKPQIFRCQTLRWCYITCLALQMWHTKGFSPVWIRSCLSLCSFLLNFFPQWTQSYLRIWKWWSSTCRRRRFAFANVTRHSWHWRACGINLF